MNMAMTLQFLGVIDPQIRHRARTQAVLESMPQLVVIVRSATTELEKSEVDDKFKKIIDARTDEIMRDAVMSPRSR